MYISTTTLLVFAFLCFLHQRRVDEAYARQMGWPSAAERRELRRQDREALRARRHALHDRYHALRQEAWRLGWGTFLSFNWRLGDPSRFSYDERDRIFTDWEHYLAAGSRAR